MGSHTYRGLGTGQTNEQWRAGLKERYKTLTRKISRMSRERAFIRRSLGGAIS